MNHKHNSALGKIAALCVVGSIAVFATIGCSKSSMRDLPFLSFAKNDEALERSELDGPSSGTRQMAATEVADALQGKATLTIWHDSFEAAQAASDATGKPILADFTGSDWCHWCVKLKNDVFETPEFKEWARDNVTLLELDYPERSAQPAAIKTQNAQLKEKYSISGYPTVLFLTAEGDVMGKLGYNESASQWISNAETILRQDSLSNQFSR